MAITKVSKNVSCLSIISIAFSCILDFDTFFKYLDMMQSGYIVCLLSEPRNEKNDFCPCENKGTDQLHSNCEADLRLCFHCTHNTIPLLPKSKISSLYPSSIAAPTGLCQTRSVTPKIGFLMSQLR